MHGDIFCWRLLLRAGRPQVGFFRLLPVANLTGAPPHRAAASVWLHALKQTGMQVESTWFADAARGVSLAPTSPG